MSQTTPLRLIKRYGNRKLYDTSESRYITLDEIARLVRSGNDVKVIDNENGDDLTAITFAQIILEEEKRRSSLLSLGLLRELVQHGEDTLAEIRTRVEKGVEAIGTIGEKAGRRVQEIVSGSVGERSDASPGAPPSAAANADHGRGFFDELIAAPQRRLEALQRSIDERIKSSVGRITNHPVVQHEVRRIERSIKKLEERLARLRRDEVDSSRGGDAVG
ncbi:MAG: polyhydroxyalkanoate synthesis regulator DNA-binding domain-containing protein [Deltaproteobacteria bacterium]|nr:polyhydroxyalkanoate synthesis regulator DNA-binding domain-containing protein [Deltaproteobacteria bacterium]